MSSDPNLSTTPRDQQNTLPETPQAKLVAIRESTEGALTAPQLPDELIRRINESDMTDTEGHDLKDAALGFCRNINVLLAVIHRVPELSEASQKLQATLIQMTGRALHEQIGLALEEITRLTQVVTSKATHSEGGAQYLEDTRDDIGTARVDLENAVKALEQLRELNARLPNVSQFKEYLEKEVLRRMNEEGKTQFMARYEIQRLLEETIDAALRNNKIDTETGQRTLEATSAQMNMAYNVVGQAGNPLYLRMDEDDLGYNQVERVSYLLNIYTQLLGAIEGLTFLKRFFNKT